MTIYADNIDGNAIASTEIAARLGVRFVADDGRSYTVRLDGNGLSVRSTNGALMLRCRVANEVIVYAVDYAAIPDAPEGVR